MKKALEPMSPAHGARNGTHQLLFDVAGEVGDDTMAVLVFVDAENHMQVRTANVTYGEAHLMMSQTAATLMQEIIE